MKWICAFYLVLCSSGIFASDEFQAFPAFYIEKGNTLTLTGTDISVVEFKHQQTIILRVNEAYLNRVEEILGFAKREGGNFFVDRKIFLFETEEQVLNGIRRNLPPLKALPEDTFFEMVPGKELKLGTNPKTGASHIKLKNSKSYNSFSFQVQSKDYKAFQDVYREALIAKKKIRFNYTLFTRLENSPTSPFNIQDAFQVTGKRYSVNTEADSEMTQQDLSAIESSRPGHY